MDAPAASGSADAKKTDRRRSLGNYVKRMSSVFKREKSSKTATASSSAQPAPPALTAPTNKEPTKKEIATEPVAPTASATQPTAGKDEEPTTSASQPVITANTRQVDRNAMQQERARVLFAKYGLTLESHEWIPAPGPLETVQRVEKTVRMRVHRTCHRCGTMYGSDKVCLKCEHKRCKKCPRFPKKKLPEDKAKDKASADRPKRKKVLTVTTMAGNELAYQPPKQRVRRTCHKCEALFIPPTATICEQCRHIRCTQCPREPAKLSKWPSGYPGDVDPDSDSEVEKQLEKFRRTWRKPRVRVRWECERCKSHFLNGSPQCPGCGHERCDMCTRTPVRKAKKEEQFDPEVVAAVEAKLRALDVDDTFSSGVDDSVLQSYRDT